jgi:DNA-directed RNA polymerase specialized sigma24 family protein
MAETLRVAGARLARIDLATPTAAPFVEFHAENEQRFSQALRLVVRDRSEAEELTQETFVLVLERWDRRG